MSDAAQTAAAAVTELKVSGHLMTLDPGVFCIFNSPGAAAPNAQTGLPGVRISAAPAPGPFKGMVTLAGFSGDGWLGGANGAALIRVSGGPAQVMVTVYQSPEGGQEAPKLQVLRLSEAVAAEPAGPAAAPADPPSQAAAAAAPPQAAAAAPPPQAAAAAPMEVAAHVYGRGDVAGRLGEWMGERGSKRWIEGFGLQPASGVPVGDIEYQAVLGRGWLSPWAEGGQFCGSRGMSLPILGLCVRLRGASAETHKVRILATFVDGTAIGPVEGGEACEAPSLAALEAFQISLESREATGPAADASGMPVAAATRPAGAKAAKPALKPAPTRRR